MLEVATVHMTPIAVEQEWTGSSKIEFIRRVFRRIITKIRIGFALRNCRIFPAERGASKRIVNSNIDLSVPNTSDIYYAGLTRFHFKCAEERGRIQFYRLCTKGSLSNLDRISVGGAANFPRCFSTLRVECAEDS